MSILDGFDVVEVPRTFSIAEVKILKNKLSFNVSAASELGYPPFVRIFISHDKNVILCYPDEGAAKRYSSQIGRDYVFCIKHRDWRTGKIERLELTTPEKVAGRNVLIVDDICSRGGTFTFTAKALKESSAGEIYLYVTHCENTIFNGEILKDGLISHVFTTESIYRGDHANITVLRRE